MECPICLFKRGNSKMAVPKAKGAYRPRCFFDVEINGSPGKTTTKFWLQNNVDLFFDKAVLFKNREYRLKPTLDARGLLAR